MKTDIILAGVGGQGILSIAAAIGTAALKNNLHVKQSETHGMSQRGGAVVSHLRISDRPIYSDLIPSGGADLIVAVEPMEALRYLPYLSEKGYIITNTTPFKNIENYPDLQAIENEIKAFDNHIAINADEIANLLNAKKSSNMVILGAASPFLNDINFETLKEGIQDLFIKKGEDVVENNIKAMEAGKAYSETKL
jgi:indolepyruvate ferredoxin oxidoreductase beta subunit